MRELGKDWTGNSVYLWAIANAVYLALLGPAGHARGRRAILQRAAYAARRLATIAGREDPYPAGFFKEFVVDFDGTGRPWPRSTGPCATHGIFGGKDLSAEFPSSARAPSTASPRSTRRRTSTGWRDAVAEAVR